MHERRFVVDGITFVFLAHTTGVLFYAKYGPKTRHLVHPVWLDFDGDGCSYDIYENLNTLGADSVKVFVTVKALFLEWIWMAKPSYFTFNAPDARRARIYRRMVQKIMNRSEIGLYYFADEQMLPRGGVKFSFLKTDPF